MKNYKKKLSVWNFLEVALIFIFRQILHQNFTVSKLSLSHLGSYQKSYHTLSTPNPAVYDPKLPWFCPVSMALLMPKSHAYDLQPAYIVICYPHHQNFRCLTCKTPLLDSIPPKPFGNTSQTHWGTFPKALGGLLINDVRL